MIAQIIILVLIFLQIAMLVRAVASWLPKPKNEAILKVCHVAYQTTEPILKSVRKRISHYPMKIGDSTINIDVAFMAVFFGIVVAQGLVRFLIPF